MDFFAAQDRARARTRVLVVYFLLGVAGLVGLLYFFSLVAFGFYNARHGLASSGWWQPDVFFWVSVITLVIVGSGGGYKVLELQSGGVAVAGSLDAMLVSRTTTDPAERRLLNIVEEMALAAGLPVPPVYVMEEQGINACAAGLRPEDAVVIVTRGALRHLSRDELQGVIGHEFSHILNGDMRLNLQLIGAVFGLMAIAIIGKLLVRARGKRDGRIVAVGLGIWAIGSLGVLFGRLIQAAVSRQRECLADAASVQFTRNPEGLAGALKKIGGFGPMSHINNAHAEETAHLYFAPGIDSFFATHPPLTERIRELDPHWDGKFTVVKFDDDEIKSAPPLLTPNPPAAVNAANLIVPLSVVEAMTLDDIRDWRANLPVPITAALAEPGGCRALVLAIALGDGPEQRAAQLQKLREFGEPAAEGAADLSAAVEEVPAGRKLPLLEMALGRLTDATEPEKNSLLARLRELTAFDRGQNLSQFALWRVAEYRLRPKPPRLGPTAPDYYRNYISIVLSAIAHISTPDDAAAQPVFEQGLPALTSYANPPGLTPRAVATLSQVQMACANLEGAPFLLKKQLLEAGALIAQADGVVEPAEAELLRALAASLGCAVPLN